MRFARSSGIAGARFAALRVSLMLLPVIGFTSGMAYWSLRTGAYAAEAVSFFGEFNYEGFDFFWLVFAPAWRSSADWANTDVTFLFPVWASVHLNSAPYTHETRIFKSS